MTDFIESLKPRSVPVTVTLPYGGTADICMGTLTLSEWDAQGEAVAPPLAPFVSHNNRGEEVRNYADPQYLVARERAEAERRWRRLTLGLLKGGNTIDGVMFDEQVKRVKDTLDTTIAAALMGWQASLITQAKAAVVDRSKRFHAGGTVEAAHDETVEPESADVSTAAE